MHSVNNTKITVAPAMAAVKTFYAIWLKKALSAISQSLRAQNDPNGPFGGGGTNGFGNPYIP